MTRKQLEVSNGASEDTLNNSMATYWDVLLQSSLRENPVEFRSKLSFCQNGKHYTLQHHCLCPLKTHNQQDNILKCDCCDQFFFWERIIKTVFNPPRCALRFKITTWSRSINLTSKISPPAPTENVRPARTSLTKFMGEQSLAPLAERLHKNWIFLSTYSRALGF